MHAGHAAALVAAAYLCRSPNLAAQARVQLSIDEALSRADTASPLVRRAQRARETVAAMRVGAAALFPSNPAVSVNVGRRSDRSLSMPPSEGVEWGIHLEQTVEIAGQRGTRLAEVDRAIQAAVARERLARVEARARVRAAYVGALIAEAQVESARHREALAERVLTSARARVQAGAASDVETHLAEAEHGRVTYDRIEAELSAVDATAELRRTLDLPSSTVVALTTALGQPALSSSPLDELLARAQLRREELRALDATRSQLDAALVRLRREVVPSPTLFLEVQRQQPGQTYVGAGLGVPLPLWRRNQGELAAVRAERGRTDEEIAIAQHEIAAEVARLHRTSLARREEVAWWTDRIVPAANANVELVTQGWRVGKFDLFRVIQISREAGEARRKELEVLGTLWESTIELGRAVGEL